MALKSYRPITPSQRQLVLVDRSDLWKGKPVKSLTEGSRKLVGAITLVGLPRGVLVVVTRNAIAR